MPIHTLALTPTWSNGMTAGAGFVAIALVIVASWRPGLLMVGAYLFGITSECRRNVAGPRLVDRTGGSRRVSVRLHGAHARHWFGHRTESAKSCAGEPG